MKKVLTVVMLVLLSISVTAYSRTPATIDENGIVLYTKNGCSLCIQAKALLDKRSLKYKIIALDNDPKQVTKLVKETNQRMFPFIFINKKFIGCYHELQELDKSGQLKQ